jgi:hypothetical protein
MFTSAFFHAFKEEFYTMSYYNHDHTTGFEHGWFFCEVLRTSFIVEILSVETQGLRESKNLDDSLVSSQNHMVLGFWFVYPQAILYGFCCTFCSEFSLSNIILHQFLFQGRQMGTKQQAATTFCAQVLYKQVT